MASAPPPDLRAEAVEPAFNALEVSVPGFNFGLGSGLPDHSLYLLVGAPGSHHDSFAQQVLYGHVTTGGKVVYYTAETQSNDIIEDLALFNRRIRSYVDDGSWIFARPLPPNLQALAELVEPHPMDVMIALSSTSLTALKQDFLTRLKEGRWSALHLDYLLSQYEFREVYDTLLYWVAGIRRHGGVHFAILTEGLHDPKTVNATTGLADGVFEFKLEERIGRSEGIINIAKLRRVLPKLRSLRIVIGAEGLAVETLGRIG